MESWLVLLDLDYYNLQFYLNDNDKPLQAFKKFKYVFSWTISPVYTELPVAGGQSLWQRMAVDGWDMISKVKEKDSRYFTESTGISLLIL